MVGQMVGQKLAGRYRLLKHLGQGGFGQAFLAEDEHLPDAYQCVVKRFHMGATHEEDTLRTAKRLFDAEAKALHRLGHHEQLPKLLAHFEDDGEFYLVEEYIPGPGLDQELKHGIPLPESKVIALLTDLLSVLSFVHEHHVIHRDIKPSNIIRRQSDQRLVLIDFGAVKQVTTQMQGQTLRANTVVIGTPGYMPSEQFRGSPKPSSDVYAVGMIAIQAITGRYPGLGELPEDEETGEILWREHAQVSDGLGQILEKMVRYDFRQRYRNATEVLEAVQALENHSTQAPHAAAIPPTEVDIPKPSTQSEDLPATQVREHHSSPSPSISEETLVRAPSAQASIASDRAQLSNQKTEATPVAQPPKQGAKKLGVWIGGGAAIAASGLFAILGTPHIASVCTQLGNCNADIKAEAIYSSTLSSLEDMTGEIENAQSIAELEDIQAKMQASLSEMQDISDNSQLAIAAQATATASDYSTKLQALEQRLKTEKDGKTHFDQAVAKASEAFKEKDQAESIAAKDSNIAKWQAAIDLLKKVPNPSFVHSQAQIKQKDYEAHVKNLNADIDAILAAAEQARQARQAAAAQRAQANYQQPAARQPSYANSSSQYQAPTAPQPTYQAPAAAPAPTAPAPAAPAPRAAEPLWGGSNAPQGEPLW